MPVQFYVSLIMSPKLPFKLLLYIPYRRDCPTEYANRTLKIGDL